MSANTAQLLQECLTEYERQRDDAQKRLEAEQGRAAPDKKKLARYQRAVDYHQRQIDTTAAQLVEMESL